MSNIAIIPARGGSKRIPRKNCKFFLGKPIIAYSIEAALKSNLFDEVMVSTDDTEIAEIATQYGANVPFFRSHKNSDDFATTYDVIEEVLNNYAKKEITFEYACCLYACAPLIQISDIKRAYEKLKEETWDSVFPVAPFSFPIQRALHFKNEKIEFVNHKFALTRSQDLEPTYHDVGQFYFMNTKVILDKKTVLTNNSSSIILEETMVQDIDNETDWKLAEIKYQLFKGNEKI